MLSRLRLWGTSVAWVTPPMGRASRFGFASPNRRVGTAPRNRFGS
jgi:hypothetical protein